METWQIVVLVAAAYGMVQYVLLALEYGYRRDLVRMEHHLESDRITYQQELFMSSQEPEDGENWK